MKISIDFDGTLWDHMAFFREFMTVMQKSGHQVGMLTGHSMDTKDKDIELMKARNFPKPDFYFGRTEKYMSYNGAVYKSFIIRTENIDLHFDDCDFALPETISLFNEHLGDQLYKLVVMKHREPKGVHFE